MPPVRSVCLLFVFLIVTGVLAEAASAMPTQGRGRQEALAREEEEDYFRRWLTEDVVYIVTPDEKAVFESLTTPEEKEHFIEQFWRRRDPDPLTSFNEFKEEHYRRIAYANERFTAGALGWKLDRGRVYIIHGPPDEIRSFQAGETYNRPMYEGGGWTVVFPTEVWRYRHIPGIGNDVELEFVDKSMSGFYQLVFSPWEKDALIYVQAGGETLAEQLGMRKRGDHPFFNPDRTNIESYPFLYRRWKDDPFMRYELFTQVQRPREIKYQDLKQLVEVNVSYDNFEFQLRDDYFRINEEQVLVPITFKWPNQQLTFKERGGLHESNVAIYGLVTSLTNQVVAEFEEDVVMNLEPRDFAAGRAGHSLYQKILTLPARMRYKLDLVLKDLNGDKIGVLRKGLVPPGDDGGSLTASNLVLTNFMRRLNDFPEKTDQMFVLGDVWIRPSIDNVFHRGEELGIYLHLYNPGIDQTTWEPSLDIRYRILREGDVLVELRDETGESMSYVSGNRVVLMKALRVAGLPPGRYEFQVRVSDRISQAEVERTESFRIAADAVALGH